MKNIIGIIIFPFVIPLLIIGLILWQIRILLESEVKNENTL